MQFYKKGLKVPENEDKTIELEKKKEIDYTDIEGEYIMGGYMPIYKKGKFLTTKQAGLTFNFIPNSNNTFTPSIKLLGLFNIPIKSQELIFLKPENKKLIGFILGKDTMLIGTEFDAKKIDESWKKHEGKYAVENDNSTFKMLGSAKITVEENMIIFTSTDVFGGQRMSFVLLPISENNAIVQGVGRQTGYTITFKDRKMYFRIDL